MADGPINYLAAMGGLEGLGSPYEGFQRGVADSQQGQQNNNILAQQAAARTASQTAQARAQQKQSDVAAVLQNPTPQAIQALQLRYPEDAAEIRTAWQTKDEASRSNDLRELAGIHGYLNANMPDRAAAALQRRIDADKPAGQDSSDDEQMLAAIQQNPRAAAGMVGLTLAGIVGADQYAASLKATGENARANEVQPSAVRQAAANASEAETKAQFAPQVIQSDLASAASTRDKNAADTRIALDRLSLDNERLGLDRDTLTTQTQLKLQELQQTGTQVTGASLEALTSAVGSSQQNQALAERTRDLADRFEQSAARGGGWRSQFGETAKNAFGQQDAVSGLRAQYNQLINSQAVKNLPPGSASDRDVQIAKQGFPPATADRAYIVSFLRGMEKMQRAAASADDRRADWISENGTIGTARRDLQVGGVTVPAGTTFSEFNRNSVARDRRTQAPVRDYLQRYGGPMASGRQ